MAKLTQTVSHDEKVDNWLSNDLCNMLGRIASLVKLSAFTNRLNSIFNWKNTLYDCNVLSDINVHGCPWFYLLYFCYNFPGFLSFSVNKNPIGYTIPTKINNDRLRWTLNCFLLVFSTSFKACFYYFRSWIHSKTIWNWIGD